MSLPSASKATSNWNACHLYMAGHIKDAHHHVDGMFRLRSKIMTRLSQGIGHQAIVYSPSPTFTRCLEFADL